MASEISAVEEGTGRFRVVREEALCSFRSGTDYVLLSY
jgi:hypothetical protein